MLKIKQVTLGFLALCLTAALFVGVTSSADYDPWYDLNDDGDIDIFDLRKVARLYGTSGTPINKTALLLDLQERVEALETGGFIGAPAYDSDWKQISAGSSITLEHNCNTTDVLVFMMGRKNLTTTESPYIHQKHYGGETQIGWQGGVLWRDLTNTTIVVERMLLGTGDDYWNYVRVMIWKILP